MTNNAILCSYNNKNRNSYEKQSIKKPPFIYNAQKKFSTKNLNRHHNKPRAPTRHTKFIKRPKPETTNINKNSNAHEHIKRTVLQSRRCTRARRRNIAQKPVTPRYTTITDGRPPRPASRTRLAAEWSTRVRRGGVRGWRRGWGEGRGGGG